MLELKEDNTLAEKVDPDKLHSGLLYYTTMYTQEVSTHMMMVFLGILVSCSVTTREEKRREKHTVWNGVCIPTI